MSNEIGRNEDLWIDQIRVIWWGIIKRFLTIPRGQGKTQITEDFQWMSGGYFSWCICQWVPFLHISASYNTPDPLETVGLGSHLKIKNSFGTDLVQIFVSCWISP